MKLNDLAEQFASIGINVVGMTYDKPEIIKAFDDKYDMDKFMPPLAEKSTKSDIEFFKEVGWLSAFVAAVWSLIAAICFQAYGWAFFASTCAGALLMLLLLMVCFVMMALYQGGKFLKELYREPWNAFARAIGKHGWMIDLAYEAEKEAHEQRIADTTEKMASLNRHATSGKD